MATIAETVKDLAQERSRMAGQVRKLDKAISVLRKLDGGGPSGARKSVGKRRPMSAASRRKDCGCPKSTLVKVEGSAEESGTAEGSVGAKRESGRFLR
jgi:hypothetical protein